MKRWLKNIADFGGGYRRISPRHKEGCNWKQRMHINILVCGKAYQSMTSGCRRTPYCRGYDLELVLQPVISLKKIRGGYRSKMLYEYNIVTISTIISEQRIEILVGLRERKVFGVMFRVS